MTEYLSCAETAKLIRVQLKAKFPGVKFSVKSSVYSGGASIRVGYTDGPTQKMVEAVTNAFAGGGFDGMIDMAYSVTAYLLPDGSAAFAQTSGTEGSGGMVAKGKAFMPVAGAKRVSFGANYIFVNREYSRGFLERALISFKARFGVMADGLEVMDGYAGAYIKSNLPMSEEYFLREAIAKRVGANVKLAA
jgi:hypothetical protein